MTESIWSLPGPRGYVAEIAQIIARGRHVVTVLPEYHHAGDAATELANALVDILDDAAHVGVGGDGPLIGQVCADISDDFDKQPATLRELLTWGAPRAGAFVLNAADVVDHRRGEVRAFLERLALDSRVASQASVHFIVIASTADLPAALSQDGDVTVATKWFWNRIARWDTVIHVALTDGGTDADTLIGEVRMETVVEMARWDLAYASELASAWTDSGELELDEILQRPDAASDALYTEAVSAARVGAFPPERVVDGWNKGAIDGWRGRVAVAPAAARKGGRHVEQHIWAAQARVLLPFIEAKRARLEENLREELGAARFGKEVERRAMATTEGLVQAPVPEIAVLHDVARSARRDGRRFRSLTVLREARNRLAHLVPLTHKEIVELEKSCLWLG